MEAKDALYLGRGSLYPLALEGALKLKEISYIHAEGYAAGELKHGPIALIDETVPTVVIAPTDALFEKTASNVQEVTARKKVYSSDRSSGGGQTCLGLQMDGRHGRCSSLCDPHFVFHSGSASGLSCGCCQRNRCGSAPQPCQICDG